MKTKKKKPTVKDISFRVQMIEEMLDGINKFILTPLARNIDVLNLTLNEYVEMKGDGDKLVNHLKKKAEDGKSKDSSPKKGKKKSTKRSRATKTVSKDSKGV
tara:strand:- start:523 stop:828 length:306 start_codon:yes stop_codon:yes gene_type:complete